MELRFAPRLRAYVGTHNYWKEARYVNKTYLRMSHELKVDMACHLQLPPLDAWLVGTAFLDLKKLCSSDGVDSHKCGLGILLNP